MQIALVDRKNTGVRIDSAPVLKRKGRRVFYSATQVEKGLKISFFENHDNYFDCLSNAGPLNLFHVFTF